MILENYKNILLKKSIVLNSSSILRNKYYYKLVYIMHIAILCISRSLKAPDTQASVDMQSLVFL